MMHRIFILLLLAFFFACKSDTAKSSGTNAAEQKSGDQTAQPTETQAVAKTKTIVFFGNSLTAALGLTTEEGFPALVQQKIEAAGLAYICVNAGLSGETTAGGVKRIEWVLRQPMDIFVLELGANDALRGLPVEESKKNLQTILDQVKAKYPNCKLVVAGMLAPPNLGDSYLEDFKAIFPAVAKANGAALIPFLLDGVAGEAKLNQPDGIHPTAEGQKIVAENVWKVLRSQL